MAEPTQGPPQEDALDAEKMTQAAQLIIARCCLAEAFAWMNTFAAAAETLAQAPSRKAEAAAAACAIEFLKVGRPRFERLIAHLE